MVESGRSNEASAMEEIPHCGEIGCRAILLPSHDRITGVTSFRHASEETANTLGSCALGEKLAGVCTATPHDGVIGAMLLSIRLVPELL